jgi:hypothetical protein
MAITQIEIKTIDVESSIRKIRDEISLLINDFVDGSARLPRVMMFCLNKSQKTS